MNTSSTGRLIENKLFPIRTVSKLTGVNSVTLRAWERRYGLIKPKRTETGHRVFDEQDIELIKQATSLIKQGLSISQVTQKLKSTQAFETILEEQPETLWHVYQKRIIEAIEQFDESKLSEIYEESLSFHNIGTVTQKLTLPTFRSLGERWGNTKTPESIAEEHFFSTYFRNKVGAQYHHKRGKNNGPLLILACAPKQQHEFSILLFGLLAHEHNYQTVILGADTPIDALIHTANIKKADGIVLSCSNIESYKELSITEIKKLNSFATFINISQKVSEKLPSFTNIHIVENDFEKSISILNQHYGIKS